MKRSRAVHLTLVVSVAAVLTGCNERPRRYCVDENQNVADDQYCEHLAPHFQWYYARGYGSVSNGTHVEGGSATAPASGYLSRSGQSASEGESEGTARGGIGASGEAASGHAGEGGHGGAGE